MVEFISPMHYSCNLLSTPSLVYIVHLLLREISKKLLSFLNPDVSFGNVIKTMMTAMIPPPNSDSDKDDNDSVSLPPPHSKSVIKSAPNKKT